MVKSPGRELQLNAPQKGYSMVTDTKYSYCELCRKHAVRYSEYYSEPYCESCGQVYYNQITSDQTAEPVSTQQATHQHPLLAGFAEPAVITGTANTEQIVFTTQREIDENCPYCKLKREKDALEKRLQWMRAYLTGESTAKG